MSDFWKISSNFHFANLISGTAVHFTILLALYSFLTLFSQRYVFLFVGCSFAGEFCGSLAIGFLARFFGVIPKLTVLTPFGSPLLFSVWQIATLSAAYFGNAFVGLSIEQTVAFEVVWIFGLILMSKFGFWISQRFTQKVSNGSVRRFELRNPLLVADIGWAVVEFVVLKFAADQVFEAVLDDFQFDRGFVGALAMLCGSIVGLRSIRRTVKLLGVNSERWQEGHFLGAGLVSLMCVIHGGFVCGECGVRSKGICVGYVMVFSMAVLAICGALSYYISIFFVYKLTLKGGTKDSTEL
jgi:hypothetical protein